MVHIVYLDDFVNSERNQIILSPDIEELVTTYWQHEDQLLVDLLDVPFFEGATRWCDLKPLHFKLLLVKNLQKADLLVQGERQNIDNPTIRSLYFIIAGAIRSIEKLTDAQVTNITIRRITADHVLFEYNMNRSINLISSTPARTLTVVVDNTKD